MGKKYIRNEIIEKDSQSGTPGKESIPILLFVDELEEGAREQAEWCAKLPNAFHHIALMPDAHQGFAMPVGGVMALDGAVMPNAVGVDIGCGMIAARTSLDFQWIQKDLEKIAYEVLNRIPVGFDKHPTPQEGETVNVAYAKASRKKQLKEQIPVVMEHADEIPYQLGTLGGGNHFIEFQKDHENNLWVMLHSGSRNIGLKIANAYHSIARQYCKSLGFPSDYAFLTLDLPESQQYLNEMQWAMDFAAENRRCMINEVFRILGEIHGKPIKKTFEVQTHHNYASWETHFGEEVLVHRKGAVRAEKGEYVIIPGSMGTASYIGIGKGYDDSFHSCSHGAGRRKGRKQAQKEISMREFENEIKNIIVATPKIHRILDEAPSAYKNIESVMEQQKDLVNITYRLEPLAVVKG